MQENEKIRDIELLAPAGGWESMVAAVQNGADSVYLGGRLYNARRFAGNFEDADMERAVQYCHARGVQLYVTLNTLLLDKELQQALTYALFLYEAGVDALIVQDMGLIRMLRANLPDFPLHASTQMAIHNLDGLRTCEELGMTRAVLSRELSLSRIHTLHGQTAVELECFAHGAMCTAVSGMCLFSSLAGGRSGNRGACAQPCRKQYALHEGDFSYPLSLADLCMLFHVNDLKQAGITCIKLEGRMKRAEYVAAMTAAYRAALSGAHQDELQERLDHMRKVFDRGQGTGYYYDRNVQTNARGRLNEEETPLKTLRATYQEENRTMGIHAKLRLIVGHAAELSFSNECVTKTVCGEMVEPALKSPDTARYIAQIGKLNDTPYRLIDCEVEMPAPGYVSIAALNALRRNAAEAFTASLQKKRPTRRVELPPVVQAVSYNATNATRLLCIVKDIAQAEAAYASGVSDVALAPACYDEAKDMAKRLQTHREKNRLLLQLAAVDLSGELEESWKALFQTGLFDGGVAQHMSQVRLIQGEKIAGYLCNATNAQSITALMETGFNMVLLSLELNGAQARDLLTLPGTGLYGYGCAQLMQLWHYPNRKNGKCQPCANARCLMDEAGRAFPLDPIRLQDGCLLRIRNCETMDIFQELHAIKRPEILALEFTTETPDEIRVCVQSAQDALSGRNTARLGTTRGHWNRGLTY